MPKINEIALSIMGIIGVIWFIVISLFLLVVMVGLFPDLLAMYKLG